MLQTDGARRHQGQAVVAATHDAARDGLDGGVRRIPLDIHRLTLAACLRHSTRRRGSGQARRATAPRRRHRFGAEHADNNRQHNTYTSNMVDQSLALEMDQSTGHEAKLKRPAEVPGRARTHTVPRLLAPILALGTTHSAEPPAGRWGETPAHKSTETFPKQKARADLRRDKRGGGRAEEVNHIGVQLQKQEVDVSAPRGGRKDNWKRSSILVIKQRALSRPTTPFTTSFSRSLYYYCCPPAAPAVSAPNCPRHTMTTETLSVLRHASMA